MKKLALAAAMALALGGTAKADIFDYAELFGGATFEPQLDNTSLNFGTVSNDMHMGYNIGGALGWNFTPEISGEIEGFYTHSAFDDNFIQSSILESFSVMGNVFWNFDCGGRWKPYIGAGIGGVQVAMSEGTIGGVPFTGDSSFVFGWQAMAGVTIPVSSTLDFLAEYRYQSASDASLDLQPQLGPAFKTTQEYNSSNISFGLRFHI